MDELTSGLMAIISAAGNDYKIALFIDGLDEFEGGHEFLVNFVKKLSCQDGVKIVSVVGPGIFFCDSFVRHPSLRMEDLTRNDIDRFVRGYLEALPGFTELQATDPEDIEELIQSVISKANGVFLWVALVVRLLSEQIRDGKTLAILQQTVSDLPQELEDLFEAIRRRIDAKNLGQATKYFQLLRSTPRPHRFSALKLWITDDCRGPNTRVAI